MKGKRRNGIFFIWHDTFCVCGVGLFDIRLPVKKCAGSSWDYITHLIQMPLSRALSLSLSLSLSLYIYIYIYIYIYTNLYEKYWCYNSLSKHHNKITRLEPEWWYKHNTYTTQSPVEVSIILQFGCVFFFSGLCSELWKCQNRFEI